MRASSIRRTQTRTRVVYTDVLTSLSGIFSCISRIGWRRICGLHERQSWRDAPPGLRQQQAGEGGQGSLTTLGEFGLIHGCRSASSRRACRDARLLLLVRWLAATNKPTNLQECSAALLSFLYRHSILAWCQYILVPCPYSPPPPPLRFLVPWSIRPSPLLLSPLSPYSWHSILCTVPLYSLLLSPCPLHPSSPRHSKTKLQSTTAPPHLCPSISCSFSPFTFSEHSDSSPCSRSSPSPAPQPVPPLPLYFFSSSPASSCSTTDATTIKTCCPSPEPPAITCLCLCRSKCVCSCCVSLYAHVCPDVCVCVLMCVCVCVRCVCTCVCV